MNFKREEIQTRLEPQKPKQVRIEAKILAIIINRMFRYGLPLGWNAK